MANDNIVLAWVLTVIASLSTLAGASFVLIVDSRSCARREGKAQNRKARDVPPAFVAISLASAAGAMMFVAVAELFGKSESSFAEAGYGEASAKLYAVLSFFGGVLFVFCSNELVNWFAPEHQAFELSSYSGDAELSCQVSGSISLEVTDRQQACTSDAEANTMQPPRDAERQATAEADRAAAKAMQRLGLRTCLAIALHNFPEGLAAFVATLADGRSGLGIAFGVILHNIPEGLCVAAPMYFATGSLVSALSWAAVAGLSELLGGLTAYLLVCFLGDGDDLPPRVYGMLFGAVNGIIVFICALGFLPAAAAFDRSPGRRNSTVAFCAGMAAISATLVVEAF